MATAAATARILTSRRKPDKDNWFISAVVEDWWKAYVEAGNMSRDFALAGSRVRASWAGMCAKRVAYAVYGVEETNPPTVPDAWRFNIGSMLHDHIQEVVQRKFPGSAVEVKVKIGEHGSGHMDVLVKRQDGEVERTISVELKTINGFGFKQAVGQEGPKAPHVMQGALNAAAMDPPPDELMIAYFAMENISPGQFKKYPGLTSEYNRFAAQWTFPREEYMQVAEDELRRLNRIVELVDESGPGAVPRIIPDPNLPPHMVTVPLKGTYVITQGPSRGAPGYTWACGYCPYRAKCADDLDTATKLPEDA